jgi:hypothetical protein
MPQAWDPNDDHDEDEAPETPLDEPAPLPVQDPPSQPDPSPYVVLTSGGAPLAVSRRDIPRR